MKRWCGLPELALDQKLSYVVREILLITSDTEHGGSRFFKSSICVPL